MEGEAGRPWLAEEAKLPADAGSPPTPTSRQTPGSRFPSISTLGREIGRPPTTVGVRLHGSRHSGFVSAAEGVRRGEIGPGLEACLSPPILYPESPII